MQPLTPAIKALLIANVALFAVVNFVVPNGGLTEALVLHPFGSPGFEFWQIFTHAFMHADVSHIAFNMLALYFLGPSVESRLGSRNLYILYFVAIVGAVAAHYVSPAFTTWQLERAYEAFQSDPSLANFHDFFAGMDLDALSYRSGDLAEWQSATSTAGDLENELAFGEPYAVDKTEQLMLAILNNRNMGYLLGASGAVSGVVAAFAVIYPNRRLQIIFLPFFSFPAKYFIGFGFLVDLVLGFMNVTNIAHFAHIGGGIVGALLAYYFLKTTTPKWMTRLN